MKITVEDIMNLYDPCRDHTVLLYGDEDCSKYDKCVGYQKLVQESCNLEVDSIGVREGYLGIWITDEDAPKYRAIRDKY